MMKLHQVLNDLVLSLIWGSFAAYSVAEDVAPPVDIDYELANDEAIVGFINNSSIPLASIYRGQSYKHGVIMLAPHIEKTSIEVEDIEYSIPNLQNFFTVAPGNACKIPLTDNFNRIQIADLQEQLLGCQIQGLYGRDALDGVKIVMLPSKGYFKGIPNGKEFAPIRSPLGKISYDFEGERNACELEIGGDLEHAIVKMNCESDLILPPQLFDRLIDKHQVATHLDYCCVFGEYATLCPCATIPRLSIFNIEHDNVEIFKSEDGVTVIGHRFLKRFDSLVSISNKSFEAVFFNRSKLEFKPRLLRVKMKSNGAEIVSSFLEPPSKLGHAIGRTVYSTKGGTLIGRTSLASANILESQVEHFKDWSFFPDVSETQSSTDFSD